MSKIASSSVVVSFALLTLFACERNEQQPGAEGDTTGTTTERLGTGGATQGTGRGTGTLEPSGTEGIERTGGRDDEAMGAGGATRMGTGGNAGRGGMGGMGGMGGTTG